MKYFIKDSRTEVKPGELFEMCSQKEGPYGTYVERVMFTLTNENIATLVKDGILIESEAAPIPMDLAFYCDKLATKLKWNEKKLQNVLADLSEVALGTVFSLLLKEIAITLDKQYPDHITKSDKFYVLSMADGTIQCLDTPPACTKYISLFRTQKDVEIALTILKELHESLFPQLYAQPKD